MVAEDADEQCHNTLHDECVTLGLEVDKTLWGEIGGEPDTALAAIDEVLLGPGTLRERLLF